MKDLADALLDVILYHPLVVQGVMYALAACLLMMMLYIIFFRSRPVKTKSESDQEVKISEKESNGKIEFEKKGFVRKNRLLVGGVFVLFLGAIVFTLLIFRERIFTVRENPSLSESQYTFGIDVSSFQRRINWDQVITSHHPIKFVFIRATMGTNAKDSQFNYNWRMTKSHKLIRGAYHYYRPDENSTKQFANFRASVKIEDGDLPPVLDIEDLGHSSPKDLREGILNWLQMAENEYSMKPILYTNRNFYHKYVRRHVTGYPLWIASYSGKHKLIGIDWSFHQFTSQVRVKGISARVDGNDYRGTYKELATLCKN